MNERTFPLVLSVLLLAGCASATQHRPPAAEASSLGDPVSLGDPAAVTAALRAQHVDWKGTRYELGGSDRKGIDCSAFTVLTFAHRFGVTLPRTTAGQVELGVGVPRHALEAGDLVFFRTGLKTRHVGIYAGNRRFLHASTSRGVTLSSLDNPYWRAKFWQARRLDS